MKKNYEDMSEREMLITILQEQERLLESEKRAEEEREELKEGYFDVLERVEETEKITGPLNNIREGLVKRVADFIVWVIIAIIFAAVYMVAQGASIVGIQRWFR